MNKKAIIILTMSLFMLSLVPAASGKDRPLDKITVTLISPQSPNSKISKSKVNTSPITVSGAITVEIDRALSKSEIEKSRYMIEYFIDGELAYKFNGSDDSDVYWLLDSTKYKNGKHQLVVNFWDKDGSSAIGIANIIIENPLSIEQIREATSGE